MCQPAPNPYITYSTDNVCQLSVSASTPTSVCTEIVPTRRKVTVEEVYTVDEKHTIMIDEMRTRMAKRKIAVPGHKIVDEVDYVAHTSRSGRSQRLTRSVVARVKPTIRYETEEYEESYIVPVRTTYFVPVTKTRKVTQYVDDFKVVTKRK